MTDHMLGLFINVPSLVMAEIAWYIRCILLVALCVSGCLAVTIGLAGIYLLQAQYRRSHVFLQRRDRHAAGRGDVEFIREERQSAWRDLAHDRVLTKQRSNQTSSGRFAQIAAPGGEKVLGR